MQMAAALPDREDQVWAAQRRHDEDRLAACSGVTQAGLDADNAAWRGLGQEVARLALRIQRACRDSQYCNSRPSLLDLTLRLVESVDDQMDGPAWSVLHAAANQAVLAVRS
jgi:hypothetical protein